MSEEQINIAIAEACGWRLIFKTKIRQYGRPPWKIDGCRERIPDYCNDLNAMHEAEGTLKIMEKIEMERLLEREIIGSDYLIWRATATQRAEAFLRTLGKWEETK
jgi:hypothetical protein